MAVKSRAIFAFFKKYEPDWGGAEAEIEDGDDGKEAVLMEGDQVLALALSREQAPKGAGNTDRESWRDSVEGGESRVERGR